MKEFIEFIAKYLVDDPEAVVVEETIDQDRKVNLTLRVKKEDVGKVIGKKGKTVIAMRILLTAIAAKEDKRAMLEILD
ncbi:MAG: KH domain-containing protein [Ignavibacteriaceae bacterium]|nr:KH domain-containing protein [Ignavibacteriaceae bacterium]HSW55836.1 KH domain-containing protein [Ignavibacteriaceae bacterium]